MRRTQNNLFDAHQVYYSLLEDIRW